MMRTGLYSHHIALGAKMVPFGGWEMPLQYRGIIEEHMTVRNRVGIFDVSHMGRIDIAGKDAEQLVDFLSTNSIMDKKEGSAIYTVWCSPSGGCIDDLIVFKHSHERFSVIANASNREKDLAHLKDYTRSYDITVEERYDEGILAVQGPQAKDILKTLLPEHATLKPMRVVSALWKGSPLLISGTGYTGSGGFELYGTMEVIVDLWERICGLGASPIGLGARNTLRMEKGFALYGNELSESIPVTETVSAWTVKTERRDFLGKEALLNHKTGRCAYGIRLEQGIPREGYPIFLNNQQIGHVTSGTMSPSLQKGIAIILVETNLHPGENVEVEIRSQRHRAKVVNFPFV